MKPQIAIVNSSSFGKLFPEHLNRIGAFADVERINLPAAAEPPRVIATLSRFHGIIVSFSPRFTEDVLRELDQLVVLCRHGIGYDNIDVKAATKLGICVTRVPGVVEQEAVAEQTILLMLAVGRRLVEARESLLRGMWAQRAQFIGTEMRGKRVGLIGVGNVGRRVAQILKLGFGAEVVGFDPFLTEKQFTEAGVERVSFEQLIKGCEVISMHCSLNESSRHCIGEREFGMMQRGVVLVNTARGDLIDERALDRALSSGYVGAYAADVAENMPITHDNPLMRHSNVILQPHLGSYTLQSIRGMGDTMAEDLERVFVKNSFPDHLIDRSVTERGLRRWGEEVHKKVG